LALDLDLADNVALLEHRTRATRVLDWAGIRASAERIRSEFDVQAPELSVSVRTLSGGNQQRFLVGREIGAAADLLVAENPTRGLDVAATNFVHERLADLVAHADAPGVLLVSTDLDEAIALADRMFAIVRGRLVEIAPEVRTREGVGRVMLGGSA
jgi:general nucleoside transport system ATP-binding protein